MAHLNALPSALPDPHITVMTWSPVQELSSRQRSVEWTQMRDTNVQKAGEALESARATLSSCAGDIQQHAAHLQQWLECQRADLAQSEDALYRAGMPETSFPHWYRE